jgi:Protein of unknown function DUF2625
MRIQWGVALMFTRNMPSPHHVVNLLNKEESLRKQTTMQRRSLKELINTEYPGWPPVQEWIAAAGNHVEVLDADRERGEEVLRHLQTMTWLPMAALALETGGVLIDHEWLPRFFGKEIFLL